MNIPLNIDWQQILLHLFNFAILTYGLYLLLYKPVRDFMAKRTAHYQKLDEEAKETLKRAQDLKKDYEQKLKDADSEIAVMKSNAIRECGQAGQLKIQKASSAAEKILNDARQSAQKERERIISSAHKEIAEMAVEAAEKLIFASSERAYDEFLTAAERSESDER